MTEREKMLEAALVECFDAAIPQAMPWTGTFSEKADYAAKMLPEHLRGLNRLSEHNARLRAELVEALRPFACCTDIRQIVLEDWNRAADVYRKLRAQDQPCTTEAHSPDGEGASNQ